MRKSVHIEGFKHANPIPNASRIGNIVMSGVILGRDTVTGNPAATLEEQCTLMFRYMRETVEAAGGNTEDIIKVSVWLQNSADRNALNAEWTEMFPDPASRPARRPSWPGPRAPACR